MAMETAQTLQQEIHGLREEIGVKNHIIEEKNRYILQLEEWILQQRHKTFGPSSEKLSPDQLGLFNEAEAVDEQTSQEPEPTTVNAYTRSKKPRVSIPRDLPREEIIHDLPEAEKICPHDGAELACIGSEDHEQLDIIPPQIKVIRHKRLKYACPCCHQHMATASKPNQPIEKSIASPGLLAFVATQKYCGALPLYRQSAIFNRSGITLDRTNLANWMIRCGELVQPLINVLIDHLHQQPYIHMDETPLQVLSEPGKAAQDTSYMWVMTHRGAQSACVFHYADSRTQQIPLTLLSQDNAAIMVDGYEWYQEACDVYQIKRLGCFAHARRYFVDAKNIQPKGKTGKADQALAWIQQLYRIEQRIKDDPPDKRFKTRQQEAKPIIDKLRSWLEKSLPHVPPMMKLGKALHYLNNQWDRLVAYLEDGHYPIDNNAAERAIRPFTIGRKNWMFSYSPAGAKASANLYSLVETAKANQLNPYEYLKHIFTHLPNANSIENIEQLLPWNLDLGQ